MWICPVCADKLTRNAAQLCCANGHLFDCAKEGYVNLLLANQKKSKTPGDSKEMINARRAFLDQGFYQPLANKLIEIIQHYHISNQINLFDAGCGEGYYLNQLTGRLRESGLEVQGKGIDVSKVAVQKAAKRYQNCEFAVASTFAIPIQSAWANAVVQVFAPASTNEIYRVLQHNGLWLQINPADSHLVEIKQHIYHQAEAHKTDQSVPDGFTLCDNLTCGFDIPLTQQQQRIDLLKMTPFYWSATPEKIAELTENLTNVTAHFHIKVLQKQANEDEHK